MKQAVISPKSPGVVGPYSHGIVIGDLVFVSGQIGIHPKTSEMVGEGIKKQMKQALENLENVLISAGSSMDNVLKTTVYLADIRDYAGMNEIYKHAFNAPFPARAAVEVSKLPKDARVEIECIAYITNKSADCVCGGDCGCSK